MADDGLSPDFLFLLLFFKSVLVFPTENMIRPEETLLFISTRPVCVVWKATCVVEWARSVTLPHSSLFL